jgi:hypothetical protein
MLPLPRQVLRTRASNRMRSARSLFAGVAASLCGAALILSSGCQKEEEDTATPHRMEVAFEGKLDPKYLGSWKAKDGSSLDLKSDGTMDLVAISQGPTGASKKSLSGHWLSKDGDLLLQYAQGGSLATIKSAAERTGSTLTLVQAGNHFKTVYQLEGAKK